MSAKEGRPCSLDEAARRRRWPAGIVCAGLAAGVGALAGDSSPFVSRDCSAYEVLVRRRALVLVDHFKSKWYGNRSCRTPVARCRRSGSPTSIARDVLKVPSLCARRRSQRHTDSRAAHARFRRDRSVRSQPARRRRRRRRRAYRYLWHGARQERLPPALTSAVGARPSGGRRLIRRLARAARQEPMADARHDYSLMRGPPPRCGSGGVLGLPATALLDDESVVGEAGQHAVQVVLLEMHVVSPESKR